MKSIQIKNTITAIGLASFTIVAPLIIGSCASADRGTRINTPSSSKKQIAADSQMALNDLYEMNPKARRLGAKAKGVLVFPTIIKGGLMFGGMGGTGALIRNDGTIKNYYETTGVSYGFQAGVQKYGYALFLMDQSAINALDHADGWELGSDPNIVVVDQGMAANLSTTTAHKGVYAYFFNQRGLMGGISLQGSKVTRIYPKN
jgi:lipid-binding SYLF domain-containing protein